MIPVYALAPLNPFSQRLADNHLGGYLFRAPYERRDLIYPNKFPTVANINVAVGKVAEVAAKPGRKIFVGHSMGAQALARYLRTEPDVDPDENVFILTGNPERWHGGAAHIPHAKRPAIYGGPGVPADTPFQVFDVARQYESWADYPDDPVKAAVDNVKAAALHNDYSGVILGDPNNIVFAEDNITYILQPTFPMPACVKWWWNADREAREDKRLRPAIEDAYTRPVAVPAQTVKRYDGYGFDTSKRRYFKLPAAPGWSPFR